MDAAAEIGRNPASKHQIPPEYGDEQADARNGDRDIFIFSVQLTTSGIGNLTRLILTLAICDLPDIHTHTEKGNLDRLHFLSGINEGLSGQQYSQ